MPRPDGEPQFHTFHTDCLPEEHRWAHVTVNCGRCGRMVHAFNNETMQDWVEWGDLAMCWVDFSTAFILEGIEWREFDRLATTQPEEKRGTTEG